MTTVPQPLHTPSPLTRLAESANAVDWWHWMLRAIGALQLLFLVSLSGAMFIASRTGGREALGVLALLERDTGIPPSVFALLFLFCVGQATRGVFPRRESLAVLIGQGAYAGVTLVYTLKGEIPLSSLASYGGAWVLCVVLILGATQRHNSPQRRTNVRNILMPVLGVSLLLYAIGLATRPDTALSLFITGTYGPALGSGLVIWLAFGGGYMLFNHILAKILFVMMTGQYIYTLLALALLAVHPTTTSLTGVASHVGFAVISAFIILIQTDYPG